ncbi:hypothetical protein [Roseobacter sp. HKCCA0434]|uniref:hypothetical protein n=1 Tax=Roseobacter sp. HKCCA0434 TaxID=3079297 RepID=UPI002905C58F|nr:hypothetical protein [Roseobacter sp. HKCCA0434]
MSGDAASVTNAAGGRIETSGANAGAVVIGGDDASVRNGGAIITSGSAAHAIELDGSSGLVVDQGDLIVSRANAYGVIAQGAENMIRTTTGSPIEVTDGLAGILVSGDRAEVELAGTIETTGSVHSASCRSAATRRSAWMRGPR